MALASTALSCSTRFRIVRPRKGLARLVAMVAAGRLHPRIELEAPFDQIAEVANKLCSRGIAGKAVLRL